MRRVTLGLFVVLSVCISCAAPRYQVPQSEQDLQASVSHAEHAYQALYTEHKAGQVSKPAMLRIDELYESYRRVQAWLMDAVKAGAVTFAKGD